MIKNHGFRPKDGKEVGNLRFEYAPAPRQTKPNVLSHARFRAFGVSPRSDARRITFSGSDGRGRFQTKPISLTHVKFGTFGVIPQSDTRCITLLRLDGRATSKRSQTR